MPFPLEKNEERGLLYRSADCVIVPYPPDTLLAKMYLRMEEEDILDQVFHEGRMDLTAFITNFGKTIPILSCFVEHDGVTELAGLTWINNAFKIGAFDVRKAEVGICFFRKFWKRKWTLRLSGMSAEWAFDHLNCQTLFGTTPEPNVAAVAFFKALGFGSFGPLPEYTSYPGIDHPVGAYVSYMTKSRWEEARLRLFLPSSSANMHAS